MIVWFLPFAVSHDILSWYRRQSKVPCVPCEEDVRFLFLSDQPTWHIGAPRKKCSPDFGIRFNTMRCTHCECFESPIGGTTWETAKGFIISFSIPQRFVVSGMDPGIQTIYCTVFWVVLAFWWNEVWWCHCYVQQGGTRMLHDIVGHKIEEWVWTICAKEGSKHTCHLKVGWSPTNIKRMRSPQFPEN